VAQEEAEQPEPCKEGDHGKFEVLARDGWARVGEFHNSTHTLTTPALLPVINPNIQTIPPAEIWEIGFEGLITNSYIIHRSDKWKEEALKIGVHRMLDFPGLIMTDSGTFQQYVYGDEIEVSPAEIVEFQRDIGVDIATMLDVFGRPDMTREELEEVVRVTAERGPEAIEAAAGTLLNGPIQGGTYPDLRQESARLMSALDFSVHPIGGIVPLMENQRYRDLVEIIVRTKEELAPERPVHLFGCGHPILFPISVALGVDLFDSAAYVLFARDGRMLTPTGTVKLDGLREWPHTSPVLWGTTPEKVRKMIEAERIELLARHNLYVTNSEISNCRQAVWDGTIWNLVEERSHCNPHLREATLWLYENLPWEVYRNSPACRAGGVPWSADIDSHPRIKNAKDSLYWNPPPVDHLGNERGPTDWCGVVFHGCQGPWREKIGPLVERIVRDWPNVMPFVYTPIGVIPYQLEDLNPFAHIVGPQQLWTVPEKALEDSENDDFVGEDFENSLIGQLQAVHDLPSSDVIVYHIDDEEEWLQEQLTELVGPASTDGDGEGGNLASIRKYFQRWAIRDKIALFTGIETSELELAAVAPDFEFVMSRTDRINNILLDGVHLFSQRLTDGGLSLTVEGAKWLHSRRRTIPVEGADEGDDSYFVGMPEVVVDSDAEPFIRAGRNVMHGFIVATEGFPQSGMPCLVVNEAGELLAHGMARGDAGDMAGFRKGIAVRVKDGVGSR
jgi:7-cyano-7-deazaguanine tRNA-ribosyltransferase